MKRLGFASIIAVLVACGVLSGARSRVVVGVPSGLPSLAPPHTASEEFALTILSNAYEKLVDVGPELDLKPALAESWVTEDERTWVFRLRDGVRFHDGRRFEAQHVVASVRASLDDERTAFTVGRSMIESVAARDRRTVVITTFKPVAALRAIAGAIWAPAAEPGQAAVGTGPYRITRSTTPAGTPRGAVRPDERAGTRGPVGAGTPARGSPRQPTCRRERPARLEHT